MREKLRRTRQSEAGMALMVALFLTVFAGFMMVPVLQRAMFHHNNAFRENRSLTAFHMAEAGIEEALWHLSYDDEEEWSGWNTDSQEAYSMPTNELMDTDGNVVGEYTVTIEDPIGLGTYINIGAPGNSLPWTVESNIAPGITAMSGVPDLTTLGSEVSVIEVQAVGETLLSLGLFSDQTLDVGGTTVLNSYDSRNGPYADPGNADDNVTAGSNGNIELFGSPLIDGNAAAGGSVILTENSQVTGEVDGGMTQVDLPLVDQYVNAAKLSNDNLGIPLAVKGNGQQVAAFNPLTGALNVASGATLTLPGGTKENPKIYYFSSAMLNGNSTLNITGHVLIYTDGNIDLNGGTVINNAGSGTPDQFQIYSSGGPDTMVKINGGAGYAGTVYAPTAQVQLNGNGDFFGAMVGGSIDVTGNGEFHYDEALGSVGPIAYFAIEEWIEKGAVLGENGVMQMANANSPAGQ